MPQRLPHGVNQVWTRMWRLSPFPPPSMRVWLACDRRGLGSGWAGVGRAQVTGAQRRDHWSTPAALHRFGQDRITSSGELVTAAPPQPHSPAPRQQHVESPTSAPAPPGAATSPDVPPLTDPQLDQLAELVHSSRRLVVLTGAGCSTESNIPDYRGPNGAYSTGFKPMTHQQFMASAENRSRYWARSFAGWYRFSRVQPNAAHEGIARLQRTGWAGGLVTQNVDRLHHKAGSREVLELHGTTHEVVCTSCGRLSCREEFQALLEELNPAAAAAAAALARQDAQQAQRDEALRRMRAGTAEPVDASLRERGLTLRPDGEGESAATRTLRWRPDGDAELDPAVAARTGAQTAGATAGSAHGSGGSGPSGGSAGRLAAPGVVPPPQQRPDGDAELDPAALGARFQVPPCPSCGGALKPNVVFFGDSIPAERAARAGALAASADALLVVGSSVQVYSAFRLAKAAKEGGARLAILTAGATRADPLLGPGDLKFEALAGVSLARLAAHPWLLVPPLR